MNAQAAAGFHGAFAQAQARLAGAPQCFVEIFRHGTLSIELYAPRDDDPQQPHAQDELYVVVSGKGRFVNGAARHDFGPGDVLFVPAGVVHRFEEFDHDLAVWVVFWGPAGGERDAAAAAAAPLRWRAAETLARIAPEATLRSVTAFTHASLILKLYAPRGTDPQQPHEQDEVYLVRSGNGLLRGEDQRYAFGPGDVLFAPAGARHRFEDFSDDLALWVVFYGPPGGE